MCCLKFLLLTTATIKRLTSTSPSDSIYKVASETSVGVVKATCAAYSSG
jgi:hypothetical protein